MNNWEASAPECKYKPFLTQLKETQKQEGMATALSRATKGSSPNTRYSDTACFEQCILQPPAFAHH